MVAQGRQTVRAFYQVEAAPPGTPDLETSFILAPYDRRPPEAFRHGELEVPVADLEKMASMKAAAIYDRGARKDFYGVHPIVSSPGWSVGRFITHAARTTPLESGEIARALRYFGDATERVKDARLPWERVQAELVEQLDRWRAGEERRPQEPPWSRCPER